MHTTNLRRHIEVDSEHNGNLFFWHVQNRHRANRPRTVIWLNGGPGCSSLDGALMEIGPFRLTDDAHLRYNDGSWDEFANVLFIDNPVGTGYSYVNTDNYVRELPEMADQIITFLKSFFSIFPEYEDDDVSTEIPCERVLMLALSGGRILCRPAHPVHCQGHSGPQHEVWHRQEVEALRPAHWQRVDSANRTIRCLS